MRIDWNRKYTTISVYAVIVFFICSLLYKATLNWEDTQVFFKNILSILSPFLLGILLAYFINPLVTKVEGLLSRIKIHKHQLKQPKPKRAISIFISYLFLFSIIVFLLAIIIPQLINSIIDFANSVPDNLEKFMEKINGWSITFNETIYYIDSMLISESLMDKVPKTFDQITKTITDFFPNILSLIKNFSYRIVNIFIAIIVSIYLIGKKESTEERSKKIIIAIFPKHTAHSIFNTATHAHRVFTSFFIGKLIDSLIIGILCFVILLITKMPLRLLISVLVGITNIIPYFGPFIGGGIGFVLLLILNPVKALWFLLIVIVLQQFDGNILGPKILGDSIGLSPLWVIFSIILFGSMFGFIGMFLGAPFFSVIKSLIDHQIDKRYNKKINNR